MVDFSSQSHDNCLMNEIVYTYTNGFYITFD